MRTNSNSLKAIIISGIAAACFAVAQNQETFPTPKAAIDALIAALDAGKTDMVKAILGPEMTSALSAQDPDRLKFERELFLHHAHEKTSIEPDSENPERMIVYVGDNEWPLPAPLVKVGDQWRFDGPAGVKEMEDRRIGRNELAAIDACNGYVAAQMEYASEDRMGDGILQFAKKFYSSPGKMDGLYWNTDHGEPLSPLGPFFALASLVDVNADKKPQAFSGYHFRILTKQGTAARGGSRNYEVDGHLVLGFALVAWPDEYGKTGVMTFIVNQLGDVYEKDLGEQTGKTAREMERLNPDSTWKKVNQDE